VDPVPQDGLPVQPMDAEETYQHVFFYFMVALRNLAVDSKPPQDAGGNIIVAQELQNEILSGRYVIGKEKLSELEEAAVAALASAVGAVPDTALKFPNGMMHPAWEPLRLQAAMLLGLLDSRIAENKAYFEQY